MSGGLPDPMLRALLWRWAGRHLYRLSFHNWYGFRERMLEWHGATMGERTKFRRTVRIDRPWNLTAGSLAMVGDEVELRAAAPLKIGERAVVSQLCLLTTCCRDPLDADFAPRVAPIEIGDDAWIAADALVLPGASLGEGSVVGARSVVEGAIAPWRVAVGDPATARHERPWNGPRGAAAVDAGERDETSAEP